jgi:hypothetical protein
MALKLITVKMFRDRVDDLGKDKIPVVCFRIDRDSWEKNFSKHEDSVLCEAEAFGVSLVLFEDIPGEVDPKLTTGTLIFLSK